MDEDVEIVIAEYRERDYTALLVQRSDEFVLSWTDGINLWEEVYAAPETGLVRLATLIRGVATSQFFANQWDPIDGAPTFVDDVEAFFDRTLG